MQRYDVAIIGSGPEGLVAAAMLARAGLGVLMLERKSALGGRAATVEFHPGFRASPYADELALIPPRLFDALGLARHGALLVPAPASAVVSDRGATILYADAQRQARGAPREARDALAALTHEVAAMRTAIVARAGILDARGPRHRFAFWQRDKPAAPWPGEGWGHHALDEFLRTRLSDSSLRFHLAADAVSGRAVSPLLAGSALHLLGGGAGRSGMAPGGLQTLGAALAACAQAAGATMRTDTQVSEIAVAERRVTKLVLGGGEEIEARAVLSTLDLKATFHGIIRWSELDAGALKRLTQFRIAGQAARVLIALDAPPVFAFAGDAPDAAHGPIHIAASLQALNRAYNSWRSGVLDEAPPVTLRLPSATDPRLAPIGKAVLTATVACVPSRLFDGGWTEAKRERLAALALQGAERVAPGVLKHVVGFRTIVGPDIESELGATAGDLDGGEIAPDQVFGFRPFGDDAEWADGRTPIKGLYLGGSSAAPAPFLLGVAGERAGLAILADAHAGRLP